MEIQAIAQHYSMQMRMHAGISDVQTHVIQLVQVALWQTGCIFRLLNAGLLEGKALGS